MTVIPDRAAALDTIVLDKGSHADFAAGHCAMEVVSWLADEGFTDAPACASPVIARYVILLNDRWDHERRQTLKPYLVRMIGTGGDGKDAAREEIAARFVTDRLLGDWLDLAGMSNHKTSLEGKVGDELRSALWLVRDAAWGKRSEARAELRAKVKAELEKRHGVNAVAAAADVAVAVAADVAAAAAAAVVDAVAVAVADAVADAAAAGAAVAAAAAADVAADVAAAVAAAVVDAVAVAVAAAAAAGVAADVAAAHQTYSAAYWAARRYYDENPLPVMAAVTELAAKHQPLALELLDALIVAQERVA